MKKKDVWVKFAMQIVLGAQEFFAIPLVVMVWSMYFKIPYLQDVSYWRLVFLCWFITYIVSFNSEAKKHETYKDMIVDIMLKIVVLCVLLLIPIIHNFINN